MSGIIVTYSNSYVRFTPKAKEGRYTVDVLVFVWSVVILI